jgi:hypothetical protein
MLITRISGVPIRLLIFVQPPCSYSYNPAFLFVCTTALFLFVQPLFTYLYNTFFPICTTPGLFTIAEGWVFARAEGGDICKVADTIICLPPRRDESELEADCTVPSYQDIHGGKAQA